jgi:hypothetical protein
MNDGKHPLARPFIRWLASFGAIVFFVLAAIAASPGMVGAGDTSHYPLAALALFGAVLFAKLFAKSFVARPKK